MNKRKKLGYFFENPVLHFESLVKEFTDKTFKEFDAASKKFELTKKINDLISGKIVNKSESQSALHPKYRSYSSVKKMPNHLAEAEIKAEKFLNKSINTCANKGYDTINILTLGIGGSYEGPKLLLEALNNPIHNDKTKLAKISYDFITGSDPNEFEHKTQTLDPENTFFIVSSKSFTSDETIESLKKAFAWSGNKKKFIAITANPDEVSQYDIEDIISFDKEIGGRYSIWSPITQFQLFGVNRVAFQKGGQQADIDLLEDKDYLTFVKRLSYSDIYLNNNGIHVRAILSYAWNLRSLPCYFQQLEMESLGKRANSDSDFENTGQIIFGGYGPIAQHSYFQLLHQGTQKISADIIAIKEDNKNLAYAQAITQSKLLSNGDSEIKLENESKINGNVPVNLFHLKKLNAYNLGYLIATWEHRVFISASILGINPFDQFGVSAGKIYTKKYLAEKK